MRILGLLTLLSVFAVSCTTTSEVSTEDLRAPFQDHKAEVDSCYTKVMKKQPDIGEGTVEMKFMINEEGKAAKTIFMKKRSTLTNKLLNACIKKTVSGWQFPSGKALDVVYPFTFEKQMASLSNESSNRVKPTAAPKKSAATPAAPAADEPKPQTELDVIDTSPPEDEAENDLGDPTPVE